MGFTALTLLRRNIEALLAARKESQTALAFSIGHDKSWLNKFLNGSREIQFKDLDRIADFFGIATYQLFQPGIARLTERRSAFERRSGQDRRIGHAARQMLSLQGEVESHRPRRRSDSEPSGPTDAPTIPPAVTQAVVAMERQIAQLVQAVDPGRQIAEARPPQPQARRRARAARRSDPEPP